MTPDFASLKWVSYSVFQYKIRNNNKTNRSVAYIILSLEQYNLKIFL